MKLTLLGLLVVTSAIAQPHGPPVFTPVPQPPGTGGGGNCDYCGTATNNILGVAITNMADRYAYGGGTFQNGLETILSDTGPFFEVKRDDGQSLLFLSDNSLLISQVNSVNIAPAGAGSKLVVDSTGINAPAGSKFIGDGSGLVNLPVSSYTNSWTVTSSDETYALNQTNQSGSLSVTLQPGNYSFVGDLRLEGFTTAVTVKYSLYTTANLSYVWWGATTMLKANTGAPASPVSQHSGTGIFSLAGNNHFPFLSNTSAAQPDIMDSFIHGSFIVNAPTTISIGIWPTSGGSVVLLGSSWVTFYKK